MKVTELNKEELEELKQHYYCHVLHENDGVSYGELASINELVSDEEIFEYYSDTVFVAEDFSCNYLPF